MDKLKLRPYQIEGANFLASKRFALLADEMRLGKTIQSITAANVVKAKKILIICPPIARLTWQREFLKWGDKRDVRVIQARKTKIDPNHEVVIASYDYVTSNFRTLRTLAFDLLIVDESHYLKSLDAKRTQAILSKDGVIHAAKRAWFLTGTPMPNHPGELWPMLYTFGATRIPYDNFVNHFCKYYEHMGRKVITGARGIRLPELRENLKSIMLRRTIADVFSELPALSVSELTVEAELEKLTPQLTEEFEMLKRYLNDVDRSPTQALAALSVVAGSISTLRRYCAISKVKPVCDLIKEELENKAYEKIVIFGVHREGIEAVINSLMKFNPVAIHGAIAPAMRQQAIDKFQNDPTCQVFVGNIQAAGTNISLSAANQIMFLEQSWVPGDNLQALMRCVDVMKKNPVFARYASLADTVDTKVQEILASKSFDIDELLKAA